MADLPTISPKALDRVYPKRTYKGRARVSLVPRWIGNWLITGTVIYFMGSYALRFMGFDSSGWDPFTRSGSASAMSASTGTPLPNYPLNDQGSFHASSDPNFVPSTALPADVAPVPAVVQIQPTYTPLPTLTPYPTQQPFFGRIIAIGYSYYWPPWGPPNCDAGNWHEKEN